MKFSGVAAIANDTLENGTDRLSRRGQAPSFGNTGTPEGAAQDKKTATRGLPFRSFL